MAKRPDTRDVESERPDESPPTSARVSSVAIPLAAVGALAAIKPEVVRSTFSSAGSVLRVAALIAGWMLFSWLVRGVVHDPLIRTGAIAVPAVLLLWLNLGPYFQDDVTIRGGFPETYTTAGSSLSGSPPPPAAPTTDPHVTVPATVLPSPVQLSTGRFRGLDGHRGSGEASVFRQPDGSHLLAFRDVSVSSVPDPVLYIVAGQERDQPDGGVRLGRFDSDRDRYVLPPEVDVDGPLTVLVWCQRFSVPVAGASQTRT